LSRTGALVSPTSLRKLLPHPDETAPSPGESVPGEPRLPAERPTLLDRRLSWLKLGPERATIAASVEGSTLRLMTIEAQRVSGWTEVAIPERAARGGQINDPVALGTAIGAAFDQYELPRRRVGWALPGFQATTRVLDLPGLKGDELDQAVQEELERVLGASVTETFMYYQRIPGRIRQRSVFVLALPKQTVLGALEALDVADIRPTTMDLRPLALARAIGRSDAIVANLEDGSLDIVVVERSLPTLIRSLPLLGPTAGRDAAQARLVDETERTLGYYDDANPDHPLDVDAPLFLTGALATGIALAERMRSVTRHPIGRLTAVGLTYPPEFPVAEFVVNVGLSLKRV
jgi:type IV pilus assembly protein PilM